MMREGPASDAQAIGLDRRIQALSDLLGQLNQESREAILMDALSRAADKKRLVELTDAVQDLAEEAKRRA